MFDYLVSQLLRARHDYTRFRHQHKNTIQALAFSPYLDGNYLAAGSRDQSLSVFDIRMMKELRMYRGHKREVCCEYFRSQKAAELTYTAVTWHPVHPLIVSGGSEGDLLYWDLHEPTNGQNTGANSLSFNAVIPSEPRATLAQAHDSNIWSLAFHPLGHLLASASNDHTTRFWSRERPGDSSSVFSGGGEKPPEAGEGEGEDEEAWAEGALPGLGVPGIYDDDASGSGPPGGAWNAVNPASRRQTDDMYDFDALPGFAGDGMDVEQRQNHPQNNMSYGGSQPGPQSGYNSRGGRSRWGP